MPPIILLILGVAGVYGDSHSLRYYRTAISSPAYGLPVFSSVGYVDDREIVRYNSDTRQYLPRVEWMKKLGDDYWEGQTERGRGVEAVYQHGVQALMSRFNQTGGVHIVQFIFGCELRDDGSTAGYEKQGYDGREFSYLDTQSWMWIPTMSEAQLTIQRWNSPEERVVERDKIYLETICIDWLKTYISIGREDLDRRVRPEVKVWGRQSDEVTKLHCLAYGFHPRAVDVKWVRNGKDDVISLEAKTILPHPDGTYQVRVSVEVPTREGDSYSCYVDHSSLEEVLVVRWEPDNGLMGYFCVIAAIAVLAVAVAVGVVVYMKKKHGYKTTNTSDTSSESTVSVAMMAPQKPEEKT